MPRSSLPSNAVRLITLATIVFIVVILYFGYTVLVPLALAVLCTFLLSPVVSRIERWGIARTPAVVGTVLVCCMIIAFIGWIVTGQLSNLANNLDRYRGNIIRKIEVFGPHSAPWAKLNRVASELQEKLEEPTTQTTEPVPAPTETAETSPEPQPVPVAVVQTKSPPLAEIEHYFGLALGPLATAGLVVVFAIFILLRREDLRDRIIKLVAHGSLTVTTQALDDAAARISRYLLMQSLVNTSFGIVMGVGFRLIGIPNAFLWGLLCAILRFIPYIGTWIAAIFPVGLSLAVFPDNYHFVYTVVFYVLVELLLANFIEPWIYGASTGMSETAVLLAAVFWAWLWGPIGLLLSTPLTTMLVVIGKHVPELSYFDTLLGDSPALEPPMRYYQRLLALDEVESWELLDTYLAKMPLENLYDSIVIPALILSERDRRRARLDEQRQKFIAETVALHIDRLPKRRTELEQNAGKTTDSSFQKVIENLPLVRGERTSELTEQKFHPTPMTGRREIRIFCMPAHTQADALISAIIAQCLEIRGFWAVAAGAAPLASEMVRRVATESIHIVAISVMPPRAIRQARYFCKRLHRRGDDTPIVVALWNNRIEPHVARRRIAPEPSVHVATSLGKLIATINQLAPLIKADMTD